MSGFGSPSPTTPAGATDPCVHCGFCLPTCASYRVLGTEMDSPRGRIHALKAIEAGELRLDATVASHFDSCLGCLACVTACPSGVRYDQLIEATRPQLNAPELRSPAQRAFRRLLFALLPYPQRLRALLAPLRAYAGTPLQGLARRSGLTRLFGPQMEAMERLLPPLAPEAFADSLPLVVPAQGEKRARVGLLLGCVQRLFDPQVNAAAVAVLSANGVEVVIPLSRAAAAP
jgi:glycolate oxidase iron-sulfur subunit